MEKKIAAHSRIFPRKSHGQRTLVGYCPRGCVSQSCLNSGNRKNERRMGERKGKREKAGGWWKEGREDR